MILRGFWLDTQERHSNNDSKKDAEELYTGLASLINKFSRRYEPEPLDVESLALRQRRPRIF